MLDLQVLYAAGDVDGPLAGEVKIGVSSRNAYGEELKSLRTYRSAEIAVRFEAVIRGKPRAKAVETSLRVRLRQGGREKRGSWWLATADEIGPLVKLIAAGDNVPLLFTAEAVDEIEREAFAQIQTRKYLGGI